MLVKPHILDEWNQMCLNLFIFRNALKHGNVMLYHSKPEGNNDTESINLTNTAPINATTFSCFCNVIQPHLFLLFKYLNGQLFKGRKVEAM